MYQQSEGRSFRYATVLPSLILAAVVLAAGGCSKQKEEVPLRKAFGQQVNALKQRVEAALADA